VERDAAQGARRGGAVTPPAWWTGRRGEWYVAVQLLLMALVVVGPRTVGGWPPWRFPFAVVTVPAGITLLAAGGALFLSATLRLLRNRALTPLPYPRDDAALVETGPYAVARHPIYGGGVLMAFGWALAVRGWLTVAYAVALLVLADVKARREERWLEERHPSYAAYRRRVRKLIPLVY
jgi:protein-S-isoprenylcysteine O-methyltransferase Ste14